MHSKHFCAMLFVNLETGICCTHVLYLDVVTSHAEKTIRWQQLSQTSGQHYSDYVCFLYKVSQHSVSLICFQP